MTNGHAREERFVEASVNYSVEVDGQLVIVENVPARIDTETGERFFSPETVERLQAIVSARRPPDRIEQTPVFRFAA